VIGKKIKIERTTILISEMGKIRSILLTEMEVFLHEYEKEK
jgi:hypothetical protein